jgi:hypothetical protein
LIHSSQHNLTIIVTIICISHHHQFTGELFRNYGFN